MGAGLVDGEFDTHTASVVAVQATRTPRVQLLHSVHVGLPLAEKAPEAHAVHEAANDAPARVL